MKKTYLILLFLVSTTGLAAVRDCKIFVPADELPQDDLMIRIFADKGYQFVHEARESDGRYRSRCIDFSCFGVQTMIDFWATDSDPNERYFDATSSGSVFGNFVNVYGVVNAKEFPSCRVKRGVIQYRFEGQKWRKWSGKPAPL